MSDIIKDLPIGKKFTSQGRTVTEGEFALLTDLTWTHMPMHADARFSKSTPFGERTLSGAIVLSLSLGLVLTTSINQCFEGGRARLIALIGYESVRFAGGLFPGDTIAVESEMLGTNPTSKPNQHILRIKDTMRKHSGEVVLEAVRLQLFETL